MARKSKFFAQKSTGTNADLKRHNETITRLETYIAESTDPVAIGSYKKLLQLLKESKAVVTESIGRKNNDN